MGEFKTGQTLTKCKRTKIKQGKNNLVYCSLWALSLGPHELMGVSTVH